MALREPAVQAGIEHVAYCLERHQDAVAELETAQRELTAAVVSLSHSAAHANRAGALEPRHRRQAPTPTRARLNTDEAPVVYATEIRH